MKTPVEPLTDREHDVLWRVVEAAVMDPSIPLTQFLSTEDKRTICRVLRKITRPEAALARADPEKFGTWQW
jgi:hypothetical protein